MATNKHKSPSSQNTVFSKIYIPSVYRKLPIIMYVRKTSQSSHTALILHPGAFENAWGDNERYKKILLWLQNHLSYHPYVIGYETSRHAIPLPTTPPTDPTYWQQKETYWKKAFHGKTFNEELEDVRMVYQYITKHLNVSEIHSLGFSLGGTLAMILSSEFSMVHKLCAIGSAISTKRGYLPVLTGYPPKQWILNRVKKFRYYLKILQGMNDTVIPVYDAQEIVQSLKQTVFISYERIAHADHMFSGKNRYGLTDYQALLFHLKHFFEFTLE